jgi:hypothetical protein
VKNEFGNWDLEFSSLAGAWSAVGNQLSVVSAEWSLGLSAPLELITHN